ncbi:predicted protein [Postia placenta Mad-698-R]|uniref:Uncharacterized protein n=1 Tax=Postia placenta MAD-698-R-SB12 TaxID=670580 RepID=A0A1X6MQH1_9APHY|nr:hypothetical protein POSPLADRAFT_1153290 [Postia placenta MAD-698-R-SB12]EED83488.1 predicted protein [Postia placenta Mad-698-R]OSX58647.1 hypothetical protein POSPLADRAFT_1153290 [Postia placenta MAD-698-R-SB12]
MVPLPSSQMMYEVLIGEVLSTSLSTLAITLFISHSTWGVIDWRPILILFTADYIGFGFDHYLDNRPILLRARAAGEAAIVTVFRRARFALTSAAILLAVALILSPLATWLITATLLVPALLWDTPLFLWRQPAVQLSEKAEIEIEEPRSGFAIKRIPGMKPVIVGVIRGCGYYAVIRSVLDALYPNGPVLRSWDPTQLVIWSTINWTCISVRVSARCYAFSPPAHVDPELPQTLADVRDFDDDRVSGVPTIPVLLDSVYKTRVLLTTVHALTMFAFFRNPYIVLNTLYTIALVWIMDDKSPRFIYRLNTHSQTPVAVTYGLVHAYRWLNGSNII